MAESANSEPSQRGILKLRSQVGPRKPKKLSQASLMGDFMKSYMPVENTYKMAPDVTFDVSKIRQRAEDILREHLEGVDYSPETCGSVALKVADQVKEEAKLLNLERFKIVCVVYIGSILGQGLNVASRCLLDERFDKCSTAEIRTGSLYGVATVYGIFVE